MLGEHSGSGARSARYTQVDGFAPAQMATPSGGSGQFGDSNLYPYASGSPGRLVDPWGLEPSLREKVLDKVLDGLADVLGGGQVKLGARPSG